jgi:hypothetical protein
VVFLDAGSTGTRAHVFRYHPPRRRGEGGGGGGDGGGGPGAAGHGHDAYARISLPEPKLKVEPGLSRFASDPAAAAASLRPLMEFARQHVPAPARARTPVRLMATAGLRLLPPDAAAAVLDSCRAELGGSGFLFRPEWAQVISGRAEGLFAWMAANYAAGALEEAALQAAVARKSPRDYSRFAGLLELGGASAQVTFLLVDRHEDAGGGGGDDDDGHGGGGSGRPGAREVEADAAAAAQAGGGGSSSGDGGDGRAGGSGSEPLSAAHARHQQQQQPHGGQDHERGSKRLWRWKRRKHIHLQLPGADGGEQGARSPPRRPASAPLLPPHCRAPRHALR